jgi:hypothetical protein
LTFNELHGIIFPKIELFITTAVRTSNPAKKHRIEGSQWRSLVNIVKEHFKFHKSHGNFRLVVPISKHISGLGRNKNLAIAPNGT